VTFTPEFAERFWARVVKTEGCWLWTGCKRGQVRFRMKQWSVGQVAWTLTHEAPLPPGQVVFHARSALLCVNPAHMTTERPVKTHCKRGHPLTPDNVYLGQSPTTGKRWRTCAACHVLHVANWRRRHPEYRRRSA
jgi:hypothetical protein